MTKVRKAMIGAGFLFAAMFGYGTATVQQPAGPQYTRPVLLQLKAEQGKLAVWLPAMPGLWEYHPFIGETGILDDPKLLLVQGVGPRGDEGLCVVAVKQGDTFTITDHAKSVRELPAGHWTFLRGPDPSDPPIPGA